MATGDDRVDGAVADGRHDDAPDGRGHGTARRVGRVAAWIAAGIVGLVVLALLAVLVLTNTDWGRERVRRIAVNALNDFAHGTVRIGRIDGNLLEGLVAVDVSIVDSTGAPLVTADSLEAHFALGAFARKRIELTDVRLVQPFIVLDRKTGEEWNFARIFPGDTTAVDSAAGPGWGSWVRFEDVTIVNGRVIVRLPWEPDTALAGAARDSAIAAALSAESRANVVRADTGFQTVYDFRDLNARMPLLRIADPDEEARLFQVAALSTTAFPFRPPAAEIRDLRGDFFVAEDSLWFTETQVRLPGSQIAGAGTFRFGPGSTDIRVRAAPLATEDVRFAYPALPAGRATGDVVVSIDGDTSRYLARGLDLRVDSATVAGDVGLVIAADTLRFRETDVRFAGVTTALIERLAPGVEIPRDGTLSGDVAVDGTLAGLTLDADVTFDDAVAGRSRVTAAGSLGLANGEFTANDLRVTLDPVQVALARTFMPDLPIGGTLSGLATVDARAGGEILLAGLDLTHRQGSERSRVTGRGSIRRSPNLYLDIDADLRPLSLATVGRFAPGIGLRGSATGPLRARGTLADLLVDSRLRFPDGGQLALAGRLDLEGTIGYDVRASMALFDASAVVATAPSTSLSLEAQARGAGTDPATLTTDVQAAIRTSSVTLATDSVGTSPLGVDSALVRVRAADGMLAVDTLAAYGPSTVVAASGTFGLREDRSGTLTYRVQADSLSRWAQFLAARDTAPVAPRPRQGARILAAARADSVRIARATEVERLATGQPGTPMAAVELPTEIPADSVAGAVYAAGIATGNIRNVDARGRAGAVGLVLRGNTVDEARIEYAVVNGLTDGQAFVVGARLDTVRAAGFALDSVDARIAYQAERGTLDVVLNQEDSVDYRARANFRLALDENELLFEQLALRFGATVWESQRPGAVRWSSRGVFVDSLDLQAGPERRIFVHGLVPTEGDADVEATIQNFQVADALALLQSDVPVQGLLTLDARMTGSATAPRIVGAAGLVDGRYGEAELPTVRTAFEYEGEAVQATAELLRPAGGQVLATANANVPLNLALKTTAPRLPDRPIAVDVDADSLPLGLIPQFTDALADVDGNAAAAVRVRGTVRDPQIVGGIALANGQMRVVPLGITLHDVAARVRMAGDTVVVDSLVGYNTGRVLVRGGIGIAEPTAPSLDLYLVANGATVLDNERGRVTADAGIAARGPFDGVYVSGAARVNEGVIYIPASDGKNVIAADDPALFQVADTAVASEAALLPTTSPLLANLRANVSLAIARDTWVRSKEANVEIFTPDDPGPLEIRFDARQQMPVILGVVATDRGEYVFQNRRFQLANGTATFVGAAELNPLLQATAVYEVQVPAQEALQIRIIIAGTLDSPQLSLESDAQPPIPQSDLISYLALGRSTSSLTQLDQGSSLTGGGAGGDFVGAGAAFIQQRLTGIAIGLAVDQLEGEGARSLGADVFDIRPADVSIEAANPLNGLNALLLGTEVEAGKYINRRTFVSLTARPSLLVPQDGKRPTPGFTVQHRVGERLRLDATFQGRFVPEAPTLESRTPDTRSVFGFFVTREWGW